MLIRLQISGPHQLGIEIRCINNNSEADAYQQKKPPVRVRGGLYVRQISPYHHVNHKQDVKDPHRFNPPWDVSDYFNHFVSFFLLLSMVLQFSRLGEEDSHGFSIRSPRQGEVFVNHLLPSCTDFIEASGLPVNGFWGHIAVF